jgi:hypothetical protein
VLVETMRVLLGAMMRVLVGTDKSAIGTLKRTGHSDEDFYNTHPQLYRS